MSKKILIDSEVIESVLECIKKDIPMSPNGWEAEKIETTMKDQKNLSVIEWHPVSEKPKIGSQIIVRFASGMFELDVYGKILEGNMFDQFDQSSIIEWAYLPE